MYIEAIEAIIQSINHKAVQFINSLYRSASNGLIFFTNSYILCFIEEVIHTINRSRSSAANCYAVMKIEKHNYSQDTMRTLSGPEKCTVIMTDEAEQFFFVLNVSIVENNPICENDTFN